jgi:hypothetical protein
VRSRFENVKNVQVPRIAKNFGEGPKTNPLNSNGCLGRISIIFLFKKKIGFSYFYVIRGNLGA